MRQISILVDSVVDLLHQMIHERLQGHVHRKDSLCRLRTHATKCTGRVSRGWIQLGQEEPSLRPSSITYNESREREPVRDQILRF